MSFIEKQKKRNAEQISSEQKRKSDQKKEEIEFKKKRYLIFKDVEPYLEKLLSKVNFFHKEAIRNKFHVNFPVYPINHARARDWVWKTDWEDLTPKLCGYFEVITHASKEIKFSSNGTSTWCTSNSLHTPQLKSREYDIEIYIKVLVNTDLRDSKSLKIIAKAGYVVTTNITDTVENKSSKEVDTHWIHADYLEQGITLPVENNSKSIDKLAENLVGILYTWELEEYKPKIKKVGDQLKAYEKTRAEENVLEAEKKKNLEKILRDYKDEYALISLRTLGGGLLGGVSGGAIGTGVGFVAAIIIGVVIGIPLSIPMLFLEIVSGEDFHSWFDQTLEWVVYGGAVIGAGYGMKEGAYSAYKNSTYKNVKYE